MLPSSPALVTVFFLTAILMGVVFMFLKGRKKKNKVVVVENVTLIYLASGLNC